MVRSIASMDRKLQAGLLPLWLLLLSIFTHALVPAESPLQRTSGSAFAASTAEVSLAPQRKSRETEQARAGTGGDAELQSANPGDDPPIAPLPPAAPARFEFGLSSPAGSPQPAPAAANGAAAFQARAPPSH